MNNNKTYYSISEVSQMLDIEEYTIRFWDNKLPGLSKDSQKGKTRFFNQIHINKLVSIKKLLDNNNTLELAYKLILKNKFLKYSEENNNQSIRQNDSFNLLNKINKIKSINNKLKSLIHNK